MQSSSCELMQKLFARSLGLFASWVTTICMTHSHLTVIFWRTDMQLLNYWVSCTSSQQYYVLYANVLRILKPKHHPKGVIKLKVICSNKVIKLIQKNVFNLNKYLRWREEQKGWEEFNFMQINNGAMQRQPMGIQTRQLPATVIEVHSQRLYYCNVCKSKVSVIELSTWSYGINVAGGTF